MNTSTNVVTTMMLVVLLTGFNSALQAQGRGHSNANYGRGYYRENPGKGNGKGDHNNDKANGSDFNSDRDHRDENVHKRYDDHHVRGYDRQYDDRHHDDRNKRDSHDNYPSQENHHNDYRHRYVTYNHHRHSHPSWAPAYGYRYNTRYIYYQDYNVYYDCHRDMFVTWSGRNWITTNRIPDSMVRVDFRIARITGVDYWDDDFDFYLQRRRPAYVNISTGW